MSAYFIVYREGPLLNQAEWDEYQRKARQMGGSFELKPLSVHGEVHPLEGKPPETVVLMEFPTVEEARAWYDSPGYQAALPHRLKAGDFRTVIVEGM